MTDCCFFLGGGEENYLLCGFYLHWALYQDYLNSIFYFLIFHLSWLELFPTLDFLAWIISYIYIYIYIYIIISCYWHGFPWLSLSPFISAIHRFRQVLLPTSYVCCKLVLVSRPTLAGLCERVHGRTSLMCSSLLVQLCPAFLFVLFRRF